MGDAVNLVTYSEARSELTTGMLLLCRPRCLESQLITEFTASRYSHVGMLGFSGNALMVGETLEHHGARAVCLREQVRAYPNRWDVYELKRDLFPYFRPEDAWTFICHATGAKYGYRHITRVYLRRRFGHWVPPVPNSDSPQYPRDCSALVHAACRLHGGPTMEEFDMDVVPGHFADPYYTTYKMTLGWTEELDRRCA